VGTDPVTGLTRFTFDRPELLSGIPPLLVMVGLFAVSELLVQANEPGWADAGERPRIVFPSRQTWKRIALPQLIGSVVGTFEGLVPGGGGSVSAFLSYNEAKRWSRHPEEFGWARPKVAAPEAANNTVARR
jgi:putative tricarboxylic transport membrane protein